MTTPYRIPQRAGLGAAAGLLSLALCASLVMALDPSPSFWLRQASPVTLFFAAAFAGAAVALIAPVIRRDRRSSLVGLVFGAVLATAVCIGGTPDALAAVVSHGTLSLPASAVPLVGGALVVERATRA